MLRGRPLQWSIPIINCAEQCSTGNSSVWNSGFHGFHCCERSEKWSLSHGIERETALSFVFLLLLFSRARRKKIWFCKVTEYCLFNSRLPIDRRRNLCTKSLEMTLSCFWTNVPAGLFPASGGLSRRQKNYRKEKELCRCPLRFWLAMASP